MNASADGNEGCIVSWMDSHGGSFTLTDLFSILMRVEIPLLAANGQNVVAVAGSLALGNIASRRMMQEIFMHSTLHLQSCMHRRSMSMAIFIRK